MAPDAFVGDGAERERGYRRFLIQLRGECQRASTRRAENERGRRGTGKNSKPGRRVDKRRERAALPQLVRVPEYAIGRILHEDNTAVLEPVRLPTEDRRRKYFLRLCPVGCRAHADGPVCRIRRDVEYFFSLGGKRDGADAVRKACLYKRAKRIPCGR